MNYRLLNTPFDFNEFKHWWVHRKPVFKFYDDFIFIRDISDDVFEKRAIEKLKQAPLIFQSESMVFFVRRLDWDSDYFKQETFKLVGSLHDPELAPKDILAGINLFILYFQSLHSGCRIMAELPPEDTVMIQGLTGAGIKLIETRLIHYNYPINRSIAPGYRKAIGNDVENLMRVAAGMRNPYDRLHADILFDNVKADEYLATYTKACVNGFTDVVLVPDEPNTASNAYIALNYRKSDWNTLPWKPAQIVLTAVDSGTNKGWYKKLVTAALHHVADEGADCLFNTTQITNKIVIYTLESLGFKLGYSRFVFST